MKRRPAAPFTAEIEGLTHDGRGISRVEGKVWFVEGALPGETVLVRPMRGRRSYSLGRADKLFSESSERCTPCCPVFGTCGGCALQHLEHNAQVNFKRQTLLEALQKEGIAWTAPVEVISAEPWHYRRKARLGVRLVPKKGGILVGFRERHSSYITPLTTCPVIHPSVDSILAALPELVESLSVPSRIPQIEVAAGENATALIFRHLSPLTEEDVAKLTHFGRVNNMLMYGQANGPDSIQPVYPPDPALLQYALPDFSLTFYFRATSFVQVNALVNQQLVGTVIDWLAIGPNDRLLDLFCGIGNFSLPAARLARQVIGVEGDATLVQLAAENARWNGVKNAVFEARDLFDPELNHWRLPECSRLLLDPPRTGALEVLKRVINGPKPQLLAYVSCNPATLARDARFLTESQSYRLERLTVADMFPHTAHIESAALFRRVDNPGTGVSKKG